MQDRQSRIAWKTINEVSRRRSTVKAKRKATNQQEQIKLWKQHIQNQLGNPPKDTHESITRIIRKQLDIKIGPLTLEKFKIEKPQGLKFSQKYEKPDTSTTYSSHTVIQFMIYNTWRCSWCNGYRRRKWTRRHEFKSWTRLIAFHIGKSMNPIIIPPAMGK